MLLEIQQISKIYQGVSGKVTALDDVSFSMDGGQFVAVRGPSGCGKTTLLLIAGGLLSPDQGQILINGENPYQLPPGQRSRFRGREIGFVFQQFHLVPYLSVLENVMSPAIGNDVPDAEERAREHIRHFGLEDRMHHVPGQLSSGERQRTALARAFLNQPKIILADEPTGNLDKENADAVLKYLTEFAESGGAVMLVTHDDGAAKYAQQVINMKAGNIVDP